MKGSPKVTIDFLSAAYCRHLGLVRQLWAARKSMNSDETVSTTRNLKSEIKTKLLCIFSSFKFHRTYAEIEGENHRIGKTCLSKTTRWRWISVGQIKKLRSAKVFSSLAIIDKNVILKKRIRFQFLL